MAKEENQQSILENINIDDALQSMNMLYTTKFTKEGVEDCTEFIQEVIKTKKEDYTDTISNENIRDEKSITLLEFETEDIEQNRVELQDFDNPFSNPFLENQETAVDDSINNEEVEGKEAHLNVEPEKNSHKKPISRKRSKLKNMSMFKNLQKEVDQMEQFQSEYQVYKYDDYGVSFVAEPMICASIDEVPLTDEYLPIEEEEISKEQIAEIFQLLSSENKRLKVELDNPFLQSETINQDQENKKKYLTKRLEQLSELGEGVKHLEEIIITLYELYRVEGRNEDMQFLKETYPTYFQQEKPFLYEEDIISVDKPIEDPFVIPDEYQWLATDSISENKYGKQTWIGRVIGKNQQYIHFRDMKQRIWIYVGKDINDIFINDLLAMSVERTEQGVKALKVMKLQDVSM